jgi:hypothetical protein
MLSLTILIKSGLKVSSKTFDMSLFHFWLNMSIVTVVSGEGSLFRGADGLVAGLSDRRLGCEHVTLHRLEVVLPLLSGASEKNGSLVISGQ